MGKTYQYKPVRFYVTVFILTWIFWFSAAIIGNNTPESGAVLGFMLIGLFVPSITAIYMVLTSGSASLKKDWASLITPISALRSLSKMLIYNE